MLNLGCVSGKLYNSILSHEKIAFLAFMHFAKPIKKEVSG